MFDARNRKEVLSLAVGQSPHVHICWSPNGNCIAVASKDDAIYIVDVAKQRVIKQTKRLNAEVRAR